MSAFGALASSPAEIAALLALATYFWVSGALKLLDFPTAVAETKALVGNMPAKPLAALTLVLQIGAPFLLLLGGAWAIAGAVLLGGFTALVTLLAHAFWRKQNPERFIHLNFFLANVSVIGGLGLAAVVAARSMP